jgi:hypothetical protein
MVVTSLSAYICTSVMTVMRQGVGQKISFFGAEKEKSTHRKIPLIHLLGDNTVGGEADTLSI